MAITLPKMGLKAWNLLSDLFDHDQLADNLAKIDMHDHTPGRGTQIPSEGIADGAITTPKLAFSIGIADGAIGTSQLADDSVTGDKLADASKLGISDTSGVRRGKSIISSSESRTNTAYGTLPTPDQVTVVMPTDGLIAVLFQATWQNSNVNNASADIFLGSNELLSPTPSVNGLRPAQGPGISAIDHPLTSYAGGLIGIGGSGASSTNYGAPNTTGQPAGWGGGAPGYFKDGVSSFSAGAGAGGPCYIFAAPGTYTVSVQFKAAAGSVTVKDRKLWVWTIGF